MTENQPPTLSFSIKDQADLTLALIKTAESGLMGDASDLHQTQIKTIMSELGTNIIKYARRGKLRVMRLQVADTVDIHIEADDDGPGIADIGLAMQDRFSTGTSLGLGLPSVRRMADHFAIESAPGRGTRVRAQKRIRADARSELKSRSTASPVRAEPPRAMPLNELHSPQFEIGCHARPAPGELLCGDLAVAFELRDGVLLALADVSGHGDKAYALATDINRFLSLNADSDITSLMSRLHATLHGTQGAAVALLHIDVTNATAHFCAVGNTRAYRIAGAPWRPISKDGVLGQRLPTLSVQSTPLKNADVIMLWTDGVPELAGRSYAAAQSYRPATTLAREVVTELGRPFDDASCIIFKWIA